MYEGRSYQTHMRMAQSRETPTSTNSIYSTNTAFPTHPIYPLYPVSHSSARMKSEFWSDRNRGYGVPEYRTTNIEIKHSTPELVEPGHYEPRTTKRAISVTTMDAGNSVPMRICGEEGEHSRMYSDVRFRYPSTPRCIDSLKALTPSRHLTRFNDVSRGVSIHRFESSGPVRYSTLPKFQSRFLR